MATYEITGPDGNKYRVTAPDDASQDQVLAYAQSNYKPESPQKTPGINDRGGMLHNIAGGLMRGAGSIGATLMTPVDAAARALGVQNDYIGRTDRREAMDDALKTVGVDTESLSFKGGKLGAEIAGTAGVGGALAKPLQALAATKYAAGIEPLIEGGIKALQTGGFRVGPLAGTGAGTAMRIAGGAAIGGGSAGLVNPEDAGTGALIGGAIPGAVQLAGIVGNGVRSAASNAAGLTTGAGRETFRTAYKAGKEGNAAFVDNMRGNVPMTDVLDSAKSALTQMRMDRAAAYRSGMSDISTDKTILNFTPIDNAMKSLQKMGSYKGQVINKNAAGTVDELNSVVSQWKSLNPAEYHTPEGLDALKQSIGDIRDATQFGTPARKAADSVYNAVKSQIEMQAPTYSKVMKDYSEASKLITEIERSLSLGNKAAADTSMRKLQGLMRNNVNTNYGNRLELAKELERKGADILPAVAGQAASSWTPRGLQGLAASGAGLASLFNPATLAALPMTSPRLMGEIAYGMGSIGRGASGLTNKTGGALLPATQRGLLNFDNVSPLLATTPVLAMNQR